MNASLTGRCPKRVGLFRLGRGVRKSVTGEFFLPWTSLKALGRKLSQTIPPGQTPPPRREPSCSGVRSSPSILATIPVVLGRSCRILLEPVSSFFTL